MTGGDVIADEDIGGVKYQRIKLVDGTAAGTALIAGDATNGLDVDVTRSVPCLVATATLANVAGSASSVTLIASNTARRGAVIYNDSTAVLYLKFGSAASTTSFTYLLAAAATFETQASPCYTGIITGIWATATGNARTTELT